ncbi:hypothetical protein DFH27DRAFT_108891 [Peziza echinospora]|nr:hypothetical protein DFH27DRAFT_108891 [Peziza echinospora]
MVLGGPAAALAESVERARCPAQRRGGVECSRTQVEMDGWKTAWSARQRQRNCCVALRCVATAFGARIAAATTINRSTIHSPSTRLRQQISERAGSSSSYFAEPQAGGAGCSEWAGCLHRPASLSRSLANSRVAGPSARCVCVSARQRRSGPPPLAVYPWQPAPSTRVGSSLLLPFALERAQRWLKMHRSSCVSSNDSELEQQTRGAHPAGRASEQSAKSVPRIPVLRILYHQPSALQRGGLPFAC